MHDSLEKLERSVARPLQAVAADDRSESAAVANRPGVGDDGLVFLHLFTAREGHDASSGEGAQDDVRHPVGQTASSDPTVVGRTDRVELDVIGGELHLDDMGAELGRDVGRVGHDSRHGVSGLSWESSVGVARPTSSRSSESPWQAAPKRVASELRIT